MAQRITRISPEMYKHLTLNETDRMKSIAQNIKCILMTLKGTVPLYREFGCNQSFVDRPINKATPLYYSMIKTEVEKYEPRVKVRSIDFEIDVSAPGTLIPILEVEILEDN